MDEVVIDVGSDTDEGGEVCADSGVKAEVDEVCADSGVKAEVDSGKADSGVKAEVDKVCADSGVKAEVDSRKADSGVKAGVLISKKEEVKAEVLISKKEEDSEDDGSWSMSPHWVVGGGGSLGEVDGAERVQDGDLSSTESSLSASGDVVGAQVNALHEHHWVKHPLGSDEEKPPVADVEGFIHYLVRGGCK